MDQQSVTNESLQEKVSNSFQALDCVEAFAGIKSITNGFRPDSFESMGVSFHESQSSWQMRAVWFLVSGVEGKTYEYTWYQGDVHHRPNGLYLTSREYSSLPKWFAGSPVFLFWCIPFICIGRSMGCSAASFELEDRPVFEDIMTGIGFAYLLGLVSRLWKSDFRQHSSRSK